MKWNIRKRNQEQINDYVDKLGINEILAQILINRNIDWEMADALLNNPKQAIQDPSLLINVEQAAKEIIQAVEDQAEIWVFSDYDVDGLTAGYVTTDFLRSVTDNEVYVYYPNRVDGYGLNMEFCQSIVERKKRDEIDKILIITVDNGTSCLEEVDYLKENGIDIVITDHHMPKEQLPNCTVVNPHIDTDETYHHLCGCAVAYKVVQMIERMANIKSDYTSRYLFAVAFGTIADIMPMTAENIALVRLGLEQVNGKDCPKAIKEFMRYIGKNKLNPNDIGWEVGPRLNASGRMGDIEKSAMLFFMGDDDQRSDIMDIIIEIEELNEERKALTKKAMRDLSKEDFSNDYVCIFDASDYPAGIAGIIAGRMENTYKKVSLVVSGEEVLVGSARAPEGIDLQVFLSNEKAKGNLIDFGGHEAAAGFSLAEEKIDDLKRSLNQELEAFYSSVDLEDVVDPILEIDGEINLNLLNKSVYESINELPYDKSNFSAPIFSISNLKVDSWNLSRNNEENICFTVVNENKKQLKIWAWGMASVYKELGEPERIDLAGKIVQNFMNKSQYTLDVLSLRASA